MKIATWPIPFRTLCTIGLTLLVAGVQAHAQGGCATSGLGGASTCVPEIDPSLASGGIALIAGAVLLVRGRRRK